MIAFGDVKEQGPKELRPQFHRSRRDFNAVASTKSMSYYTQSNTTSTLWHPINP